MSDLYTISDRDFKKLSTLVYQESGITMADNKKSLMVSRLAKRLKALKLESFGDYYDYVAGENGKVEITQMLDLISTNKTHFFREPVHFKFLKEKILPPLLPVKKIKIWSSACSSGEEPYTIAMTLFDHLPNPLLWDLKILASDISTRVLSRAEKGIYHSNHLKELPLEILHHHFLKGKGKNEDFVKVKPHLSRIITFQRINLMDDIYPIEGLLDLIFCRNVMIYFDRPTQESLMEKFHHYLKPGGYLFIGHSESLQWLKHSFDYIGPTIYRKSVSTRG